MESLAPSLPVELYWNIVRWVKSKRDLGTLCRVSRAMRADAERALYRSCIACTKPSDVQHLLHICSHLGKAWQVDELELDLYIFEPNQTVIQTALRSMVNLRSLTVLGGWRSDVNLTNLLKGVTVRLHHLILATTIPPESNTAIKHFFLKQSYSLHELDLTRCEGPISILRDVPFQNLRVLATKSVDGMFVDILKRGQIECLSCKGELLDKVDRVLLSMRSLSLYGAFPRVFEGKFPHLIHLQVDVVCVIWSLGVVANPTHSSLRLHFDRGQSENFWISSLHSGSC